MERLQLKMGRFRKRVLSAGVCLLMMTETSAQTSTLDDVVTAQTGNDTAMAVAQERVNELVDLTQNSAARYSQTMAEVESLNRYNGQLQNQVDSQDAEVVSIQQQLGDIEVTNREVLPLMENMLTILDEFVGADIPFLLEERTLRIANLRDVFDRADVTVAEKYRRLMEAYQIELEYGRTLDAYEGTLGDGASQNGADQRTVQFVRLGRVSLLYQTLDGTETGYWDADQQHFQIDNSHAGEVTHAISVATQEVAPDLLRVPVHAPVAVQVYSGVQP